MTAWPGDAPAAVSLTFDFDADVGLGWRNLDGDGRLTSLSEATFGAGRGIERIAQVLESHDVAATFYVPGQIAEKHPGWVHELFRARHDIGHHGYQHLINDRVGANEQQEELLKGVACISEVIGQRPMGFRSPGWEMTGFTLNLLLEQGFRYDSSLMGDDRPYWVESQGSLILEFPVHWSLDDWAFYGFSRDQGGVMHHPDTLIATWVGEVSSAIADQRMVTLTMHPEVTGRGYRAAALSDLISWMKGEGVWIASHSEILEYLETTEQLP